MNNGRLLQSLDETLKVYFVYHWGGNFLRYIYHMSRKWLAMGAEELYWGIADDLLYHTQGPEPS